MKHIPSWREILIKFAKKIMALLYGEKIDILIFKSFYLIGIYAETKWFSNSANLSEIVWSWKYNEKVEKVKFIEYLL